MSSVLTASAVSAAQQHVVVVANNFFSPENIVIEVGDTIRWNNGFGTHNVFSCIPEQAGCDGEQANETFTSGPGSAGPWTYSYTFAEAGRNRYLCQPHFAFMWGTVTVVDTPPVVSDGKTGQPATVDRAIGAGPALTLTWDTSSCSQAVDHLLVYGSGGGFPSSLDGPYLFAGSVCSLGNASPYAWETPPPTPVSGDFVWWLLVATDGATIEGSWGRNSGGERQGLGPGGASQACDIAIKDTSNICGL